MVSMHQEIGQSLAGSLFRPLQVRIKVSAGLQFIWLLAGFSFL